METTMKKAIYSLGMLASAFMMSGCVSSLGQEDFSCPNIKKGGVCGGPRDVYELTNNRVNLEGMTDEELEAYYDRKHASENPQHAHNEGESSKTVAKGSNDDVTVYEPRSDKQQTPDAYDVAKPIPQQRFENGSSDSFSQWPSNGEPMAPEPLAVMQPAEVMRVLVAAYTDDNGYANMPGYVYVEVTPRQWSFGKDANKRPARVVPLELRKKTQSELNRQRQRSKGVDPMEVINPMNRD